MRMRNYTSISDIFFLLATGVLLLGLSILFHQQYPLAGDIAIYSLAVYSVALAVLVILKTADEIWSLLHRSRARDKG